MFVGGNSASHHIKTNLAHRINGSICTGRLIRFRMGKRGVKREGTVRESNLSAYYDYEAWSEFHDLVSS